MSKQTTSQLEMFAESQLSKNSLSQLTNPKLINLLTAWAAKGALRQLDLALAKFIAEQDPAARPSVLLATALVSQRNSEGHVCISLAEVLHQPASYLAEEEFLVTTGLADLNLANQNALTVGDELAELLGSFSLENWLEELAVSKAVTQINSDTTLNNVDIETVTTPLVLVVNEHQQALVYLRRYWVYEQQIKQALAARLAQPLDIDLAAVEKTLTALFKPSEEQINKGFQPQIPDWQKLACALAARSSFSIITGGPGTGKTTTVVRLLVLLQTLQIQAGKPPLVIRLAAPTGKAAARLKESLTSSLEDINQPKVLADCKEHLPTEVTTLHRLLGSQPNTRHFRHNAANPIPADLVVIDEASMVDVEMLANLLTALSPSTRLVLLGDKDQLASVEAGSVLGDFCLTADKGNYTPATANWLAQATGQELPPKYINEAGTNLAQVTCQLRHSYRFDNYKGIGKLATAVNSGTASLQQLEAIFADYQMLAPANNQPAQFTQEAHLNLIQLKRTETTKQAAGASLAVGTYSSFVGSLPAAGATPLKQLIKQGYSHYLNLVVSQQPPTAQREALDKWALAIFAAHQQFQLLTATRKGTFGVEALNQLSQASLQEVAKFKPLFSTNSQWYNGRPILVTRNDYSLKLMNGDLGICLEWPAEASKTENLTGKKVLRVAFPDGKGGVRWVLPSRLQNVETVFAMTVHKSQGSEFTHTALVLPASDNPVLTKELLYTAITRSSQAFTLVCPNKQVLKNTLTKQVTRVSGLQA